MSLREQKNPNNYDHCYLPLQASLVHLNRPCVVASVVDIAMVVAVVAVAPEVVDVVVVVVVVVDAVVVVVSLEGSKRNLHNVQLEDVV